MKRSALLTRKAFTRRRRATGPTAKVRGMVKDREDQCCAIHGDWLGDLGVLHHRANRGAGGVSDASHNRPPNLLYICWAANARMEDDPYCAGVAREAGWKVSRYVDPAGVPVQIARVGWVLLSDDGAYESTEPDPFCTAVVRAEQPFGAATIPAELCGADLPCLRHEPLEPM